MTQNQSIAVNPDVTHNLSRESYLTALEYLGDGIATEHGADGMIVQPLPKYRKRNRTGGHDK